MKPGAGGERPRAKRENQPEPDEEIEAESAAERPYGSILETERQDVMAVVRELFSSPDAREGLERDEAIRELTRRLGFLRVGPSIRETLEGDLLAASRRGILETRQGRLHLLARSIADYDRDFLKEQFLASLPGYNWIDREEALRCFARWLGFRRAGPTIVATGRSLINGLLRAGRLESAGASIRRVR